MDFRSAAEAVNLYTAKLSECIEEGQKLVQAKEQKEKKEAQKRIDNYWATHSDRKKELEKEKTSLKNRISTLKSEIRNLPEQAEKVNVQNRIDTLITEKKSLGLFKIKERTAVQEKINAANLELNNIIDRLNISEKKIEKQIAAHEERISTIDSELTKPR